MTQPLLLGDEPVAVRADDASMLQRHTVERLQDMPARIGEDDHLHHLTIGELLVLGLAEHHPRSREPVADVLQRGGIRALPARGGETIVLTGHDDQAGREIVHAQVERTVDRPFPSIIPRTLRPYSRQAATSVASIRM